MRLARPNRMIPAASLLLLLSAVPTGELPRRDGRPQLQYDCCEVSYGSVTAGGLRLRTIATKPKKASGKLRAILFVAWLSCDTVEASTDGWGLLLEGLARDTGAITLRLDKPGVGDSEGDCSKTDYETELLGYEAALRSLAARDDVDPRSIFLFGGSMGGATAPLIAQRTGIKPRGIAVFGAFAKTWFEHMIEIERRRLANAGDTPEQVNDKMRGYGELHSLILHAKLTPKQALARRPSLAPLWYDEPEHLYGRPISFYQQAQEMNVIGAWSSIDASVLSMWGDSDWIMSREDHEIIASLAGKRGKFVVIPKVDHFLMSGKQHDRAVLARTLEWLRSIR